MQFRTANEVSELEFKITEELHRCFFVTEFSHPRLHAAFDLITYDGGGGAGHHRFPVPIEYAAQANSAEKALAAIPESEFEDLIIGEAGDCIKSSADARIADHLMNLFFNDWQTVAYEAV